MKQYIVLRFVLIAISVGFSVADCDKYSGPSGSTECVLLQPYYSKHQWATCLTSSYIQTFSKEEHICRDPLAIYCWYQCMIEIHDLEQGLVYDDCACGPDAPTGATTLPTVVTSAIPDWCFSPSGDECGWYRECLETRYPCKQSGNSYALDYAEKFCNLYEQHYTEFDSIGQQWIDGVRKCLQVNLVPILRPFVKKTCEQIKQMAFDSHPGCYLTPPDGKPSICDIGVGNWARVFWTVKSAVTQAPVATFKQMIEVMKSCGEDVLIDGMGFIQLKIKQTKDAVQETLESMSETLSKTMSDTMGWQKAGILYFGYPTMENDQKREKRSTHNDTVNINILLADSSQYDLNSERNQPANVSEAAIDVAKAIERGDVPLKFEVGMNFTDFSVCMDTNCRETSLQVTPAPPKISGGACLTAVNMGVVAGVIASYLLQ